MRHLWPIPALVVAGGLFVGGLVMAVASRPKPDPSAPLAAAVAMVEASQFEEALQRLNTDVLAFMDHGSPTPEQRREFFLARARALSGGQKSMGVDVPANHRSIVDDYGRARAINADLPPADVSRLGESLVALDRVRDAETLARELPDGESARRVRLFRAIVEKNFERLSAGSIAHAAADGHAADAPAGKDHASPAPSDHGAADAHAADKHAPDKHAPDKHADAGHADAGHADAGHAEKGHASGGHGEGGHGPAAHALAPLTPEEAKARAEQTLDLLAALASSPDLSPDDAAWVLTRQAEALLQAGRAEEAANKLVRRLAKLTGLTLEQQGELRLLLGRAYAQQDDGASAVRHLDAAWELLPPGTAPRAQAGVLRGQIAQAQGRLEQAREMFQAVRNESQDGRAALEALLGLAEISAADREAPESRRASLEQYAEVVEQVQKAAAAGVGPGGTVPVERVSTSLMQRFTERRDSGLREDALRYAQMAESLHPEKQMPAEILRGIGSVRRELADEILTQASAGQPAEFGVEDLDPATRGEVKLHLLAAGDYLERHASAVLATDGAVSGESLWLSADSYDRAGDMEQARKVFSRYVDGASDNDPRRPEARFRLAQVFQATRDYAAAAALYRDLVDARTRVGGAAGVWGERAIVPLAIALISDQNAANDEQAEALLTGVVDGAGLAPDAAAFRDALIELGSMYYERGKYPQAIARLEQAAERYPEDRRAAMVRLRLADSHRLEAESIEKTLGASALPQSEADELRALRVQHLRTARAKFDEVRRDLEQRPSRDLTSLERTGMRNAFFYSGDCSFELGDYGQAIETYDAARLRYSDDPASLVAMMQIVASYQAMGRAAEARTAVERTRQQLARFPESAWNDPTLPMQRKHWERWLESAAQYDQAARAGESGEERR